MPKTKPTCAKNHTLGAGLTNMGNTCFLNAVLQCLTHTVLLVQSLFTGNHQTSCHGYKRDEFCAACHFQHHIVGSLKSVGRVISPSVLVDNLSYFSSSFGRGNQEDAHEFLQCFLDRLDSCFDNSKHSQDDTPVKKIFGGLTVSKLRCCSCKHSSNSYEPTIDLSLEIEDVESIGTALKSFTKIEKMEDPEATYMCGKCMKEVIKEKQNMLKETPPVAVLHLKRFKIAGSFIEKIKKHVAFPLELDLLPYTSGNHSDEVEVKYDLYAVVVHKGISATSGHYYSFVRSAPGTWYKFNDEKVTRVKEEYVLAQQAYILFYARQGTPWFSSYAETQLPYLKSYVYTSPRSVLDSLYSNCNLSQREFSPIPPRANSSSDGPLFEVTNISPSTAKGVIPYHKLREAGKRATISTPQTSTGHPSPDDIYDDEPPEFVSSSAGKLVRNVEIISSKRKLREDVESPERKEAHKKLKTMPGSRMSQLMAAMGGSRSEGSVSKKRSRTTDDEPAEMVFSSVGKRPRYGEKMPSKTNLKEARWMLKTMRSSRRSQSLADMGGSYIEGSVNNKRSRTTNDDPPELVVSAVGKRPRYGEMPSKREFMKARWMMKENYRAQLRIREQEEEQSNR